MHAPRQDSTLDKLLRMRYFIFAVLLHLFVLMMLSTVVVFKGVVPQQDFESGYVAGVGGNDSEPPPPLPPQQENETVPVSTRPASTSTGKDLFSIEAPSPEAPAIPLPNFNAPTPADTKPGGGKSPSTPVNAPKTSFANRAPAIREMVKAWGRTNGRTFGGTGRQTTAEFKCYIAQYSGDWKTTLELKNSKIWRGSLVNLLNIVQEWSRGKIRANVIPVPLALSSTEIFDIKPPFIYFTGHQDFTLTPQEVDNLRKYLIQGGCIWGDNGLAGRGSRFDVAFRREMKRVLPSEDQQFVRLSDEHPIFTQSYIPMRGVPPGMNYYREPIEGIEMDGSLAVVYTLNDYSDMFLMAFKPGTSEPDLDDGPKKTYITDADLWKYRNLYFRNFTPESCKASFEFGMNIIVHLLTRWDEKLLLAP